VRGTNHSSEPLRWHIEQLQATPPAISPSTSNATCPQWQLPEWIVIASLLLVGSGEHTPGMPSRRRGRSACDGARYTGGMETNTLLLVLLLLAALAILGLQFAALRRRPGDALADLLRDEQRAGRGELREQLESLSRQQEHRIDGFGRHLVDLTQRTDARLDELRSALNDDAHKARLELATRQQQFADSLGQQVRELAQRNELGLAQVRATLEQQLQALQADNAAKLEQMRATVDEKLHATLETRLGQSFKLVSERLEAVQRGLGEMQSLAAGVGDLKRVLTNVKDRGGWGERATAKINRGRYSEKSDRARYADFRETSGSTFYYACPKK
jgi:hypothetical protein